MMPRTLSLAYALRRLRILAEHRTPMFDQNRFAKYAYYFTYAVLGINLLLAGLLLNTILSSKTTSINSAELFNSTLFILLAVDFVFRLICQNTPTHEIKSLALLPLKRSLLINSLIANRLFSTYNLFPFLFLIPFGLSALLSTAGIGTLLGFWVGWWLLIELNALFYLLCRNLIEHRISWSLLPVIVYAPIFIVIFFLKEETPMHWAAQVGNGLMHWNPIIYLIIVGAIALLYTLNYRFLKWAYYAELAKQNEKPLGHITQLSWLERFGEIGEYLKLEFKITLRCVAVKSIYKKGILMVVAFCLILSFTKIYQDRFMEGFISIYCFSGLGVMILGNIMSFEGNYLDGLMSRKEGILSLLRAKYYFYCIMLILPTLLLIPAYITHKITPLAALYFLTATMGPIYFTLFQLAVYNKQRISLNEKFTRRTSTPYFQQFVVFAAFMIPLGIYKLVIWALGETEGTALLIAVNILFILLHPLWIRNIYTRFMKRRYENMQGMRCL